VAERTFRTGWVSLLFILAILLGSIPVLAQAGDSEPEGSRYFSAYGHSVAKDFLKTYDSVPEPGLVFGNPITEAFQEQPNGRIIQYFERARFELFPENPPELRVVISPLGKLLYPKAPSFSSPRSLPGCRYIPESRVNICYDFLEFYDAHGGAAQFGYPIANYEEIDGRIVQYFQRARFEYHPDLPAGEKVQLTDLGKQYFTVMRENPVRLLPVAPPAGGNALESMVTDLKVRAFSQYSVMHSSGEQTIYITVQDQRLFPVEDAKVSVKITLPSGEVLQESLAPTNKFGITKYTFLLENQPTGLAIVKVNAEYSGMNKQNTLSFRVWQ
jgi:hypothetical protein